MEAAIVLLVFFRYFFKENSKICLNPIYRNKKDKAPY
jgi:hypothetical protein